MSRKADLSEIAAILGAKGGKVKGKSKRRDVDYAALGKLGGKAGRGKKKPRRRKVKSRELGALGVRGKKTRKGK